MFDVFMIKKWILQHEADEKAINAFWINFENFKKEDSREFNEFFPDFEKSALEVKIRSIAVNFSNNYPDFDYNHVIITIPIIYKHREIGYYKLLLNFDGSLDDDFFVLD